MKVHIDIDCTPEEARHFFGLPDVRPMQDVLMKEVQDRMMASLEAMSPESMFKFWLPATVQGFEEIQKFFWSRMGAGAAVKEDKKEDD